MNESQISSVSNNRFKNKNEFEIQKGKLDTVREVNSEFSNRKIENKKNYKKENSNISSSTEKISSERCIENYDKKTNQLMKYFPKKNSYEFFRVNSYNFVEHKSSFFNKHTENS